MVLRSCFSEKFQSVSSAQSAVRSFLWVLRAYTAPMSTGLAQLACDRYEIADALHRYAFGLDHGDPDSLASAFTEF